MNTEFHPDDVLGSFSALRREKKACARYQCDLGDLAAAPESAQVPRCHHVFRHLSPLLNTLATLHEKHETNWTWLQDQRALDLDQSSPFASWETLCAETWWTSSFIGERQRRSGAASPKPQWKCINCINDTQIILPCIWPWIVISKKEGHGSFTVHYNALQCYPLSQVRVKHHRVVLGSDSGCKQFLTSKVWQPLLIFNPILHWGTNTLAANQACSGLPLGFQASYVQVHPLKLEYLCKSCTCVLNSPCSP